MNRTSRSQTIRAVTLAAAVAALASLGCRDSITDPTQGFIEILSGDVAGVEVFVDGVSQGVEERVGPLDAGRYSVGVARDGFGVSPGSVEVEVVAGSTATASFALVLLDEARLRVTATDEVLGTEVVGAEILVDLGVGLVSTGKTTPAVVGALPPGPATVVLRRNGFQDCDPRDVTLIKYETLPVDLPMGPARAVLAEMFTYSVCPNCPDSSHELEQMQEADPTRVYVLEWHRTARLPMFDPRWLDREAFYGSISGWPAVVFQGGTDPAHDPPVLTGSQSSTLAEYRARTNDYLAECDNDCPLAVKVVGSITAAGADVDVHVLYRGGQIPTGLVLYAVLSENHALEPGNQPYFSYVARDIHQAAVSFRTGGEVVTFARSFAVDGSWVPGELHVTAWIQSSATLEVLAVGGI